MNKRPAFYFEESYMPVIRVQTKCLCWLNFETTILQWRDFKRKSYCCIRIHSRQKSAWPPSLAFGMPWWSSPCPGHHFPAETRSEATAFPIEYLHPIKPYIIQQNADAPASNCRFSLPSTRCIHVTNTCCTLCGGEMLKANWTSPQRNLA
jgi:hypothetical protein